MKRLVLSLLLLLGSFTPINSGGYVSGSANCPSSGNAQVSATSYFFKGLTVTANPGNTGVVWLGGPNVNTSTGTPLNALSSATDYDTANSINPATEYFACTVSGDSISWRGRQ
jgi:hypothetical protein